MKDNDVNGINRPTLAKCIYFSPHINLNDTIDNATIKIEIVVKRKMEHTNT
jgi:hypothetical protein